MSVIPTCVWFSGINSITFKQQPGRLCHPTFFPAFGIEPNGLHSFSLSFHERGKTTINQDRFVKS